MPDLCFYAPWIMKEPIPDPFRMMLEKAGKSIAPSWAYVTCSSDTDSDPEAQSAWETSGVFHIWQQKTGEDFS